MCVAAALTGSGLVHVVTGDARLRVLLYGKLYRRWRDICHSRCVLGVSQRWDDALFVGPGGFDDVVAWVSCWVFAASVGAVGPALEFLHVFSCSWGRQGERGTETKPLSLPHPTRGGCVGNLSGAEFAYVHTHVSGFLE